jgi:hypothetical protein
MFDVGDTGSTPVVTEVTLAVTLFPGSGDRLSKGKHESNIQTRRGARTFSLNYGIRRIIRRVGPDGCARADLYANLQSVGYE